MWLIVNTSEAGGGGGTINTQQSLVTIVWPARPNFPPFRGAKAAAEIGSSGPD